MFSNALVEQSGDSARLKSLHWQKLKSTISSFVKQSWRLWNTWRWLLQTLLWWRPSKGSSASEQMLTQACEANTVNETTQHRTHGANSGLASNRSWLAILQCDTSYEETAQLFRHSYPIQNWSYRNHPTGGLDDTEALVPISSQPCMQSNSIGPTAHMTKRESTYTWQV